MTNEERIIKTVCRHFDVTIQDIKCSLRTAKYVNARRALSNILYEYFNYSPIYIASVINRDRSSIFNLIHTHNTQKEEYMMMYEKCMVDMSDILNKEDKGDILRIIKHYPKSGGSSYVNRKRLAINLTRKLIDEMVIKISIDKSNKNKDIYIAEINKPLLLKLLEHESV